MLIHKCECCGSPCTVEGRTTQYYAPILLQRIEKLIKGLERVKYHCIITPETALPIKYASEALAEDEKHQRDNKNDHR